MFAVNKHLIAAVFYDSWLQVIDLMVNVNPNHTFVVIWLVELVRLLHWLVFVRFVGRQFVAALLFDFQGSPEKKKMKFN